MLHIAISHGPSWEAGGSKISQLKYCSSVPQRKQAPHLPPKKESPQNCETPPVVLLHPAAVPVSRIGPRKAPTHRIMHVAALRRTCENRFG